MIVIVMGVAGSGKTTVGRALAERRGWPFHDADDFHPPANVARMRRGEPLTDADREPWLAELNDLLKRQAAAGGGVVLACSALKRGYRDRLARGLPEPVRWVYLKASAEVVLPRMTERKHFMPPALMASQFATLEEPAEGEAIAVDAGLPLETLIPSLLEALERPAIHPPDEDADGPGRGA